MVSGRVRAAKGHGAMQSALMCVSGRQRGWWVSVWFHGDNPLAGKGNDRVQARFSIVDHVVLILYFDVMLSHRSGFASAATIDRRANHRARRIAAVDSLLEINWYGPASAR